MTGSWKTVSSIERGQNALYMHGWCLVDTNGRLLCLWDGRFGFERKTGTSEVTTRDWKDTNRPLSMATLYYY